MRHISAIVRAIMLVAAGAAPAVAAERVVEKDPNLIWSDEFDGTALDLTKGEHRQLGPRRDAVNATFERAGSASPAGFADEVVPIDWRRFDSARPLGDRTLTVAKLLNTSLRYNLAWAQSTYQVSPDDGGYLVTNMKEDGIRPPAGVAVSIAIALKTGVYDERIAGVPAEEAKVRAIRLIRGVVSTHQTNTRGKAWGDGWQTALWAVGAGQAAWLLWDDLDADTRRMAGGMVEYEADRFLRPGYKVPYWNGQGGDTKAEENAWNAMIHQLAVAMMPHHRHVAGWKRIGSELMVSAYAAKQDWESNETVIDGRPVKDWLNGYNLRDDGAVVNHNIVHCDYMACIMLNLRAYVTQPLAGQPVSQAARFNADRVYRALVTQDWPSPPYEPPGGTMYIPGKAEVYYPQGTDWSRYRFDVFYQVDMFADILGLDRGLPHRAAEWLPIRSQRLLEMQARHPDGHLFAKGEFTTYPGCESEIAWGFADTLLLTWLHDRGALLAEADWNRS
jgi:hypothetical protein